ncbi:MAG TPA: hypothetical protein VEJ86_10205 [Candidatus Binataceae bacterium]|nr:hypothetical protein [Candidatus Binataceae bacterium]
MLARLLPIMLLVLALTARLDAYPYSDFFTLEPAPQLSVNLLGSAIGNESRYAASHEGFQLEQTVTPYIDLVGRAAAYQIYQGGGWDSPLTDHPGTRPRNFGVFLGGVSIAPVQGTTFAILGGRDVGDSTGARIEGDFSSWIALHSRHPINVSFVGEHFYNNGLSSGAIDLRAVVASSRDLMWLFGAGGQLWGGGSEPHLMKEFGPALGVLIRPWETNIDFQAGYGNNHGYGIIAVSRHFTWDE